THTACELIFEALKQSRVAFYWVRQQIQLLQPVDKARPRVVCRCFLRCREGGHAIGSEIGGIFLLMKIERSADHRTAGNGFELLPRLDMRADEGFVCGWRIRSNNRVLLFEFIR